MNWRLALAVIAIAFACVARAGYVDQGFVQCSVGAGTVSSPSVIGNISGSNSQAVAYTPSAFIDGAFGSAQGDLLYRNATSWTVLAPGTAGQCLATGGATGNPSWSSVVTSVALSLPGIFTVSGSPVTGSGTLGATLATETANSFWAGPSTGAAAAPTFRSIVPGDVPTLNQNTTGTASNITATSNATLTTLSSLALPYSQLSGTVPTWNQNTTGTAANITATSNSTLTTLSSLSLPTSQLTGTLGVANGGTGTGTALTQGSVVFAGASGVYSQNNSKLYWLNSGPYLGIGTTAPDSGLTISTNTATLPAPPAGTYTILHLGNLDGVSTTFLMDAFAGQPQWVPRRADGTAASPSAVQANDVLGAFVPLAYGATGYQTTAAAKVEMHAAENFSDTTGAGYLSFFTRPTGTVAASTERVRITSTGSVGIGTTGPLSKLDVAGGMAVGTYAGATAAPTNDLIVSGAVGIGTAAPAQALDVGATGLVRGATFQGASATPTVAYGAAAGTGPATAAIIGSMSSGYIQFTTGTATTTGTVLTLTTSVACPNYWFVAWQPNNLAAAGVAARVYNSGSTATTVALAVGTTALAASTAYAYNWVGNCY